MAHRGTLAGAHAATHHVGVTGCKVVAVPLFSFSGGVDTNFVLERGYTIKSEKDQLVSSQKKHSLAIIHHLRRARAVRVLLLLGQCETRRGGRKRDDDEKDGRETRLE